MSTTKGITHAEGVGQNERYLRDYLQCVVTLNEPVAPGLDEIADNIGWPRTMHAHSLDWKCSDDDAAAHRRKPWVAKPELGVGVYRWIVSEPHVVTTEYLPGWLGHLWYDGGTWTVVREATPIWKRNVLGELALLCCAVRNLQRQAGRDANDARPSARNSLSPAHIEAIKHVLIDGGPSQAKHLLAALPDLGKRFRSAAKLAHELSLVAGEHNIEVLAHGGPVTFRHRAIG